MSAQSAVRSSDQLNPAVRVPAADHELGGVVELMGAPMSFGRNAEIYGEGEPADELRRVQEHILLLIKSAQERVAAFLLEMEQRVCAGNAVELPMSRQDIADYLGLTIETVSRTLTNMENASTIELSSSRRIVLRNRGALNRLNS